jgi:hypothetical protein
MVEYTLHVIVEKVAVKSQEVVQRDTITTYEIKPPTSIVDLGLRHAAQIALLEKIQHVLLQEQAVLIASGNNRCPNCGRKIKKNGYTHSQYHAVFRTISSVSKNTAAVIRRLVGKVFPPFPRFLAPTFILL